MTEEKEKLNISLYGKPKDYFETNKNLVKLLSF